MRTSFEVRFVIYMGGIFVEQSYYYFDGKSRAWVECQEPWIEKDIEKFSLSIVDKGMGERQLDALAEQQSPDHLLAYVDIGDFDYRYSCVYKKAAARWRLQLYRPQKTAIILVDVFSVMGTPDGVELHRRGSKQYSLRLDYGKWQYTAIPSKSEQAESGGSVFNYKYDWTDDGFDFSVEIPQIVADRVMTFLKELSQEEFGFIPTVPEDIPPAKLMKYFTQFPLDVNVGWYVDMLGYDFARKIIRTNDTNFDLICDYLQLPKTKGLQKAYRENGRSLAICFFLQKIGITDINLWPHFYNINHLLGQNLDRLGIDRVGAFYKRKGAWQRYWWGDVSNFEISWWWKKQEKDVRSEYDPAYVGWQMLCSWLMDKWEPVRVAEILHSAMEGGSSDIRDCLNMWFNSYTSDELTDEFVQAIYRTGFSKETHDVWTAEQRRRYEQDIEQMRREKNARHKHYMEIEFTLAKGDLMKEEDTPQGSFKIARNGKELFELSEIFHNCVFYLYTEKMNNRECAIYYLEKNGQPVACIEVVKGVITQALGDHNHILKGEIKDAVVDWGIRHNLEFKPIR